MAKTEEELETIKKERSALIKMKIDRKGTEAGAITEVDEDFDIVLNFHGIRFAVTFQSDDINFLEIFSLVDFPFGNSAEKEKAIKVCNEINFQYKVVKFYAGKSRVWPKIELFIDANEESFEIIFWRSIKVLTQSVKEFKEKYNSVVKPSKKG